MSNKRFYNKSNVSLLNKTACFEADLSLSPAQGEKIGCCSHTQGKYITNNV